MGPRVPAPLVGIYAPAAQSGKSTLADGLAGFGFIRLKFAGALRTMLSSLLAYQGADQAAIADMLDGAAKQDPSPLLAGRSPRYAMRSLGTEWGRDQMAPDVWVRILLTKAATHRMRGEPVVVDDMRFPNEAQAVRDAGGLTVRVTRPDLPPQAGEHPSEGGLDGWDFDLDITNYFPDPRAFVLTWAPKVSALSYQRAIASGMS
ncbi:deoxynucleoside-5'-monophosphate kinase [Microcystis phage Mae-Yong1326-1]|nr:deoxynucleoside-5'-monophosphate kinase [Microcystis phage Mae-Yong1326-1]